MPTVEQEPKTSTRQRTLLGSRLKSTALTLAGNSLGTASIFAVESLSILVRDPLLGPNLLGRLLGTVLGSGTMNVFRHMTLPDGGVRGRDAVSKCAHEQATMQDTLTWDARYSWVSWGLSHAGADDDRQSGGHERGRGGHERGRGGHERGRGGHDRGRGGHDRGRGGHDRGRGHGDDGHGHEDDRGLSQ